MLRMSDIGFNWGSARRAASAQRWERQSAAMGSGVTQAIVDAAEPAPGMQVLDLACGTGAPALQIARRVSPGGRVIGIDLAAAALEIAQHRAHERNLDNVEFQQHDAQNLPFADATFDLVTSRFGLMFFSDLPRALADSRRVLRPGGRFAAITWGTFEQQTYFRSTFGVVLRELPGAELPPAAGPIFKFGTPGTLSSVLQAAGFRDIREQVMEVPWVWPGAPAEIWQYVQESTVPFRPLIDLITLNDRQRIESRVVQELSQYERDGEVRMTAVVVIVTAAK